MAEASAHRAIAGRRSVHASWVPLPQTRRAEPRADARRVARSDLYERHDELPAAAEWRYLRRMKTFEDVVRGERDVVRIEENEHHIAFLSSTPLRPGHTIVVTKRTVAYLFDLDSAEHARLWEFARVVALRIRELLPCERVCVGVIGWQVRHVHVHLVPTDADGQFPPLPGSPASAEELRSVASRIVARAP